jgi:hypothetical protein
LASCIVSPVPSPADLPYMYQDGPGAPPKPSNSEVQVERFDEWTAHVREFGGFPSGLAFMREYEALRDALEKDDERDFGKHDWAIFSVYNEPTELEGRHNEVLVRHKSDRHANIASV